MIRYQLFAIDRLGRVDRGFEHRCNTDDEAIRYAESILEGSIAEIEVMREQRIIAHVRHHAGRVTIVPTL
jgi:predicted HNH restriction endonuclease